MFDAGKIVEELNLITDTAIAENRIVGSVVSVAHRGQVIYQQARGMAERDLPKPMTDNAIFLLSSLTKPMVSAVVMCLINEGILSLSDPVTRWLPDFQPRLADGSTPVITIHHLLTHTAGLSYGFSEPQGVGPYRQMNVSDGFDQVGVSLADNLQRISSVPLLFAPGTSWHYSVALDVLGGVIAAATGESLAQIIHSRISKPLGLVDTDFCITKQSRFAPPYMNGMPQPTLMGESAEIVVPESFGGGVLHYAPRRILDTKSYQSGGAGMAGTAPEFMHFLLALTRKEGPLLPPAMVEQMMRLQVNTDAQTQGPGWGFGYGWAVLGDPQLAESPLSEGSMQWGGVYGHTWIFDPVRDLALVSFTNTAIEGLAGTYPQQLRDVVYRR